MHILILVLKIAGVACLLLAGVTALFATVLSAQTSRRLEVLDEEQAAREAEQERASFRARMFDDVEERIQRGKLLPGYRDAALPRVYPKRTDTEELREGTDANRVRMTGRGCRGGM